MYNMKIVLFGTGNVASAFGNLFRNAGFDVLQVYGRTPEKAKALADRLRSKPISDFAAIDRHADVYVFALSDTALFGLGLQVQLKGKLVLHTAGTVAMDVLNTVSERNGILYPLQSLRGDFPPAKEIPLLLQAANKADEQLLTTIAKGMGCPFQYCTDAARKQLHLSAVWVNNFPNLLYSIAYRICRESGNSFELILPLMRETVKRIGTSDPWEWQTGPALRRDTVTLDNHLALLDNHPEWKELYQMLSESISRFNPATG